MSLTYGEMFAGYGGLGMGVQTVLGGHMAWCAEIDPAPARILAHHWLDVPNLGDVTTVDWDTVPKVDILTGGFPCQDVSHAGKRLGLRPGTRTGLWSHMAYAIDRLRPSLVVAENVRGLLSATADGDLEPCPWCVGDGPSGALRALGAVLGDLADLRYDAWWCGLRAADVGAAHGRFRVFVFATPSDAKRWPWRAQQGERRESREAEGTGQAGESGGPSMPSPADADLTGLEGRWPGGERGGERAAGSGGVEALTLLPTPRVSDYSGPGVHGSGGQDLRPEVALLRTPTAQLAVNGGSQHPDKRKDGGHGPTLADEVEHLLPTPRATRGGSGTETRDLLVPTPLNADAGPRGGTTGYGLRDWSRLQDWCEYDAAIRRHETAFGHPAPPPTQPGRNGQPRLSPAFVEWLMGLPAGHVTDVPGLTRNDQLKALGNGVVPQQAAAATRAFLEFVAGRWAA